jgi:hypothetical protein
MTKPRIDALTDQQAITVLGLVLEHQRRLPDPGHMQDLHTQTSEAAAQPVDIDDATVLAGVEGDGQVTPGALARDALNYLAAEKPDLAGPLERAIAMSGDPLGAQSRFEPLSVSAGVLVVLALQTDLQIERGTNGKWRFKVHKKAMSDNALTRLLAKLITSYTGGASQ